MTMCFQTKGINVPFGTKLVGVLIATISTNIMISLFGTVANGLVIMAYYRNRRLRTIQNTIFLLLAITDISVTAVVEPTFVADMLGRIFNKPNCFLSETNITLSFLFLSLSLVTITILSVHSFITLACPYRSGSSVTKRRSKVIVSSCWIFVTAASLGTMKYGLLREYFSFFIVITTLSIVFFSWIWTYRLLARHRKAIQATQTSLNSEVTCRRRILRSTVTAFAVVFSLVGCYLFGVFFVLFIVFLNAWKISLESHFIMSSVTLTLLYFNSFLNPCLVFWRKSDFREEIKNLLRRRKISP